MGTITVLDFFIFQYYSRFYNFSRFLFSMVTVGPITVLDFLFSSITVGPGLSLF